MDVQVLPRPKTDGTREIGVPGYTQAGFKGFWRMRTQELRVRFVQKMKNPAGCLQAGWMFTDSGLNALLADAVNHETAHREI